MIWVQVLCIGVIGHSSGRFQISLCFPLGTWNVPQFAVWFKDLKHFLLLKRWEAYFWMKLVTVSTKCTSIWAMISVCDKLSAGWWVVMWASAFCYGKPAGALFVKAADGLALLLLLLVVGAWLPCWSCTILGPGCWSLCARMFFVCSLTDARSCWEFLISSLFLLSPPSSCLGGSSDSGWPSGLDWGWVGNTVTSTLICSSSGAAFWSVASSLACSVDLSLCLIFHLL